MSRQRWTEVYKDAFARYYTDEQRLLVELFGSLAADASQIRAAVFEGTEE